LAVTQENPPRLLLKTGKYFACGKELFRVNDISDDYVMVENCLTLDLSWIPKDRFEKLNYTPITPCGGVKKGGLKSATTVES